MKKLFLTLLSFCLSITIFAQAPVRQWDLSLGGDQADILSDGIQTSDGGYLAAGSTTSDVGYDITEPAWGDNDFWLIKLNADGTRNWEKRFGGSGSDGIVSVKQTSDGGYIAAGGSTSGISGDRTQDNRGGSDFWVVKMTSTGVKQWDVRFGGDMDEYVNDIILTSDGGYLLGGRSKSGISGDKTEASRGLEDYWVVKISSTGVKQWDKSFGGNQQDYLSSIVPTSDGGYLLGGYSSSQVTGDKTQDLTGGDDYWVVKINSSGIKQWDAEYGGSFNEVLTSLKNTTDGGFILGGYSNSNASGSKTQNSNGQDDYWVLKISSTGVKQWDATFGGSASDQLFSLEQTSDGGYLLGGGSASSASGDKTSPTRGGFDYWALKLNSSGVKQWNVAYGGSDGDHLQKIHTTSDGGYIFFGYSWSDVSGDKTHETKYNIDYWVLKAGATATTSIAIGTISPTTYCPGTPIFVSFVPTGTFNSGNVFTAQLSDSTGSFTNPTNIGTHTGIGAGTIEAMIPLDATQSSAYRIRVIGSSPSIIGNSSSSPIEITTAEVPTIIVNGSVLTASHAQAYQWFFYGVPIDGANQQTYTATESGEYSVAILDITGCVAFSVPQTITLGSSPTSISISSISSTSFCAGQPVSVSFTADGTFSPVNEFIAQISDQTGNFSNATTIGKLSGTISGTIDAFIPPTIVAGSGYLIRVNASDPITTGTDNGTPLTVTTAATPSITVNGLTLTSSVAQSYQWCLNGEPIDNALSRSYTATENGDYTVIILDNDGCMAVSDVETITSITPPGDPCGANATYTFSLVKDVVSVPSYSSSGPRCFYKVADNKVFFFAKDPDSNTESFYFTDGTASGTILLKANLIASDIGNPVYSSTFCTFGNKICFVGKVNSSGMFNQVWISDGTLSGTYALTSFTTSQTISQLTVHNQKLYFKTLGSGGTGSLYQSNGTANSAVNIESIASSDEYSSLLKTWNGKLYLITKSKVFDYSNNTRTLVFDYYTNHQAGCIASNEIVNGKFIYQSSVNCTGSGYELRDIYEVDLATGAEQSLSSSIFFSNPVDYFRKAIVFKNAVYFYYNDNSIANEVPDAAYIYKYDGSTLSLLHTYEIDSADISFGGFTTDGNRLLFTLFIQSSKKQTSPTVWSILFETNGTSAGLKKLFDISGNQYFNEGQGTYSPNRLCILGSKVFFNADSLPYGSYPVSRLMFHDGISAHKIFPSATFSKLSTQEMVAMNETSILTSASLTPRSGMSIGLEPYLLSCSNGSIGFDEVVGGKHLVVYPNPTTGKLNIDLGGDLVSRINLYSLVGELVLTTTNSNEIDLSSFKSGIYILEIESGATVQRQKVVLTGR